MYFDDLHTPIMILNFDTDNKDITQYVSELLEDRQAGIKINQAENFILLCNLDNQIVSVMDLFNHCYKWGYAVPMADDHSSIIQFDFIDGSCIQIDNYEIPYTC